ncbi:hypothetical protein NDN08_004013 [Rhodosorus marinus]|uniref:Coiled-coil domain-containing protein 6 n=1 Tax=Rhodosorus marinus TaxID=101924 RepID=A0AAV8UL21_9RHOD|nr:hypothetical protein NDN08_004013 [Rhodosorus marinus]
MDTAGEVESLNSELESLKEELTRVHDRRQFVEKENERLRYKNAEIQKEIEMEEENITNRLNKKLLLLSGEKEQLARQIEQEEEYLTNTLQTKLNELRKEKVDIENQLEQEQECIVNKLQRQLDELRNEKSILKRRVEELSRSTTPRSNVTPSTSRPESPSHGHSQSSRTSDRP